MKTIMNAVALATTIAAAGISTAVSAQALAPAVIVVVDMDRVFQTTAAGKQAQIELKARADALETRVQQLRTQYTTEEQTLGKTQPAENAPAAAATAWQTKVKDYQARRQRDEADVAKRNQDFQGARQSVIKQINDAATPLITVIMREKGASIALAEGATLQHSAAVDVTPDLIARLDKSLPRVSTATPAAK